MLCLSVCMVPGPCFCSWPFILLPSLNSKHVNGLLNIPWLDQDVCVFYTCAILSILPRIIVPSVINLVNLH